MKTNSSKIDINGNAKQHEILIYLFFQVIIGK